MKEKNYIGLCMRYSESCKRCPRNNKCSEELLKESNKKANEETKKKGMRI